MKRRTAVSLTIVCLFLLSFFQLAEIKAQESSDKNIGYVFAVAFSPDGKQIALGSTDDRVRVLDAETGKQLYVSPEHKLSVRFVEFIPKENRLLSAGGNGNAYVWDLTSGKLIRQFEFWRVTFRVSLMPDGKTLMSGRSQSVYDFYDITTGTLKRTINQQNRRQDVFEYDSVFDVAPDGKSFLSRGAYKTEDKFRLLRLRSVATGKDRRRIKLPKEDTIEVIKISPDGKTTIIGGSKISLWNLTTGKLIRYVSKLEKGVRDIAFSPDGKTIVSVGYGVGAEGIEKSPGSIYLWDVKTGKMIREFVGHNRSVNAVAFSPDGTKIVTGGNDVLQSPLRVWNVATGKEIFIFPRFTKTKENDTAQINLDVEKM